MGEEDQAPDIHPPARRLGRREILIIAAGAGGLAAAGYGVRWVLSGDDEPSGPDAGPEHETPSTTRTAEPVPDGQPSPDLPTARWSDAATWGGRVPTESDMAVVDQPVLLDVDATVAGVRIESDGVLVVDPSSSRRLASRANIVVRGRLTARPANAAVVHQIDFVGVDESRFTGGHTEVPLDEDVGLWVIEAGLLDVQGSPKTSWTHLTESADKGETTITVDDATGWQIGDEIVITPTETTTVDEHWVHHDRRVITAVDGQQITFGEALAFPHPAVAVRPEVTHRAEVLNLTRNVIIQGTPEGRSHVIMLMTTQPQQLGYVGLRHMGPRQGEEEVLGRYAVHFHVDHDGSRGSLLEGVVAYDSTGHGFAAHLSNGVTFRECIAHDMVDDAFWWDLSLEGGRDLVPSDDIVYERCVASFVKSGGNSRFNLTGFLMGAGDGNIARGCVATGVEGGAESSAGFHWPSHSRDDNVWTFEDNIAHNNRHSGIYFWQNGAPRTIVDRFSVFHCGQGIFAGSYSNLASYRDCTIYACESNGLIISALPARKGRRTGETITYEGMYIDQAGLSDYAVHITKHLSRGDRVTLISGSTFMGGRTAQIGLPDGGDHPQRYDITDCVFEGNEFWLATDVSVDTLLRVDDAANGSISIRRADQPGEARPEWNASVSADG